MGGMDLALPAAKLPDLRRVPLAELPVLAPAAVDKVVQRVLPGTPVVTVRGTSFGSSV